MRAIRFAGCAVVFAACYNPQFTDTLCSPMLECPDHLRCDLQTMKCTDDAPDAGGNGGNGSAGSNDAAMGRPCLGTDTDIKVCVDRSAPAVPLPSSGTLDTSTASSQCLQNGTYNVTPAIDACVIVVTENPNSGTISVSGARPLILFARTSLTLAGTLLLANDQGQVGPGADAECPQDSTGGPETGPPLLGDGGGGGGGGFGTAGGNGGDSGIGTAGGSALPAIAVGTALRGGCPGALGGGKAPSDGSGGGGGNTGGAPGRGGGAVLLLAAETLTIDGTINASGGGGGGGKTFAGGGGGGGSGGMIVLDAPTVQFTVQGRCFANGGGGGEAATGGSNNPIPEGRPGTESPAPDAAGAGGSTSGTGTRFAGPGGAGGLAAGPRGGSGSTGGMDSHTVGGGGGGGGGVGVIKIFSTSQPIIDRTRISPDPG